MMVSNKNLKSIFTDIANAIRAKTGKTEKLHPINYADEISKITIKNIDEWIESGQTLKLTDTMTSEELYQILKPGGTKGLLKETRTFFYNCKRLNMIPYINTSNVTDMKEMFAFCYKLVSIPLLDTSKVTNMMNMFNGCSSLKTIPQLDASNVTDMSGMFDGCQSLTIIPLLDTSNVTNMSYMFYKCKSLTSIPALDVSKVTSMWQMFDKSCTSLKELHMKNINTDLALGGGTHPQFDPYWALPLEHDAILEVINNLVKQIDTTKTLTLGPILKAKLSDEEIKVATDKGWTVA